MKICSIKCPLCGSWMATLKTAKGRPWLYCGKCKIPIMIVAKAGMETFNKVCQEIDTSELPPETLKKYKEKSEATE